MRLWNLTPLVAGGLLCLSQCLLAQETTGSLTGTVTDSTGATLAGVSVVARNVGTGLTQEVVTKTSGGYTVSLLPIGTYEVTFQLQGFQSFTARDIHLHVNDHIQLNATLTVGKLATTVEVTAAAELVQPTPAVQSLMGPTQIQELPLNTRNFIQLATLVPGVSSDLADEVSLGLGSTVSISINGARRNAVNWLVDGANNVDVGSNITLLSTPTLDSIEEFKIITSSYAAEWPRSGGGVINVVTKSGTNEFRGTAYEYLRNDAFDANSFFRKQSSDPSISGHPARLRYNNFGYTLGGPIQKNRFFFFFSEEWRRISRETSATATVPDPAWLTDPTNSNYVPPAQRDPNAVALLSAWPAANLGTNRYQSTSPDINNTRQEVVRLDYTLNPTWRLMGRFTHDLSQSVQPGGLFFGTAVPHVATTNTDLPGTVLVLQATTTINSSTLNEVSYQRSTNKIGTTNPAGTKNQRSDYGLHIPTIFPGHDAGLIPFVSVSGLSQIGANQLYNIEYLDNTVTDNLSLQRGSHYIKLGGLAAFEQKNENAANAIQGNFVFASGGGQTAFQNFLRGNAAGTCGANCSYSEPQRDVTEHLRWHRLEFYIQDSWKVRPGFTLDYGLRYSLYPGITDVNDVLTNFSPALYNPARVPTFTGSNILVGTGDPLNGIIVAAQNSPYGRAIYPTDKSDFGPRVGFSWDPRKNGKMIVRGAYGIYYDEALIGIFEQNSFTNPPIVNVPTFQNAQLSNPAAGISPSVTGVGSLIASSAPFNTPRLQQWNVGFQRQLYSKGIIDIGYVGSRGDNLIRPVDINQPQPGDVVRLGIVNQARPYLGYGTINMRQTTARSQYHGLLVNFRHEGGHAGILNLSYTLSQEKTDSTNDRDAIDLPQNPLDLNAEYAVARTDRTHIFTANYIYELPFFKDSKGFLKQALGGWQIAGITTLQSGPPISRVVTNSNGSRRGIRANEVSDPFANLPANVPGGVYWFNPAAFAAPADGTYGTTGRAIFRLPGRAQTDLTLSKNFYPADRARLQLRLDLINAFNHTQLQPTSVQNVCPFDSANPTSCVVAGSSFGQITDTRLPREVQFGLHFFWN